ncbi:serine hydroxymethyltransferase [Candidatus Saccharibacteria bacterium]|jgi:glycine hydroxymethyltransferase|nr:serine hydroxymethyltransferase [Candidatus Saccharibacteria bacterium]
MKNIKIAELIAAEEERQKNALELIPSENYASEDVREASGSIFTNKYSEGYPGRRYYGGQENTDKVEILAIELAKKLYRADHANVQPHSGAQANQAVYWAWCNPGDTILAMDYSHGGHLTHGHSATALAKTFNFVQYGVKDLESGEIDFDELRQLAIKFKPKIILAGFSSYTKTLEWEKFVTIGNEVGAMLMADVSHIAGLIAGGVLENPLDSGFHVLTTTTHKTLRGPRGGLILSKGKVGNPIKKISQELGNLPTLIDKSVFPGIQGGPQMQTIAAKAVAFEEALQPEFKTYAQQILDNAKKLAEELQSLKFKLVFGGTENHMILIDVVESFGISGSEAQKMLEEVGITTNKNIIPNDKSGAFNPSGLRIGVPAITTIGAKVEDMIVLAELLLRGLTYSSELEKLKLREDVLEFRKNLTE